MQDNDYNYRLDQYILQVSLHRKEIQDLRYMINDKNRQNNDLHSQIIVAREQIGKQETECIVLKREAVARTDLVVMLNKDKEVLRYELNKQIEEKAKDQSEIHRMHADDIKQERELEENHLKITRLEYELHKAKEREGDLARTEN